MGRKLIHIILIFVLLLTTTGINLSQHICKGKLVAVSLSSNHLSCCSDEAENCCQIHSEWIHLALDFIQSQNYIPAFNIDTDLSFPLLFDIQSTKKQIETFYRTIYKTDYPPPLRLGTILAKYQSYLL